MARKSLKRAPPSRGTKPNPDPVDELLKSCGAPPNAREAASLPVHLVYFLLADRLGPEALKLRVQRVPDRVVSAIPAMTVDGNQLVMTVRPPLGLSGLLPKYFLDWMTSLKTGEALAGLIGVIDNAVLHDDFSIQTLAIGPRDDSFADRFVVDLLGLEAADWSHQGLAAWQRLLHSILMDENRSEVLRRAISLFFADLDVECIHVDVGDGVDSPLPERACIRLFEENRAGLGEGRLGGPVLSVEDIRVRLGPLTFDQYWAFLPPEEAYPSEKARAGREPGQSRALLLAIARVLLPVTTHVRVELVLGDSAKTSTVKEGTLDRTMMIKR